MSHKPKRYFRFVSRLWFQQISYMAGALSLENESTGGIMVWIGALILVIFHGVVLLTVPCRINEKGHLTSTDRGETIFMLVVFAVLGAATTQAMIASHLPYALVLGILMLLGYTIGVLSVVREYHYGLLSSTQWTRSDAFREAAFQAVYLVGAIALAIG